MSIESCIETNEATNCLFWQAAEEAVEAEKARKELGLDGGEAGLRQMIMQNKKSRASQAESFFAQLEAKYAEPEPKKSKKTKKGKWRQGILQFLFDNYLQGNDPYVWNLIIESVFLNL